MKSAETTDTIFITGPTASGKTARAVAVAMALDGEIVSADSRQVYRSMTIGTGKDLEEYGTVPYHLIDIVPAGYKYNLYEYLRDARASVTSIQSRGHVPVVCGGTGLYLESLLSGVSMPEVPENPGLRASLEGKSLTELTEILSSMKTLHNVTDVDTAKRAIRAIEIQTYYQAHPEEAGGVAVAPLGGPVICVDIPRDARRSRIEQRLRQRLADGMVDEVKALLDEGIPAESLIYYGLEYKFLTLYLTGQLTYDEMVEQLLIAIHQFAKRQLTWFRGMERRGYKLHWLPYDMPMDEFVESVRSIYQAYREV